MQRARVIGVVGEPLDEAGRAARAAALLADGADAVDEHVPPGEPVYGPGDIGPLVRALAGGASSVHTTAPRSARRVAVVIGAILDARRERV